MSKYQHIIFDLDHTLWDFDANCQLALSELFESYEFEKKFPFTLNQLIVKYKEINTRLWDNYHRGMESKETIRYKRFIFTFQELGVEEKHIPSNLNADFMKLCPTKGQLIPGAKALLDYLSPKYKLHILSNGFVESQHVKLEYAGILPYFQEIVLSENCGWTKPQKEIFEYTLQVAGANKDNAIMVGDDLLVDVLGAKNFGIDQVYFNRHKTPHQETLFYETDDLLSLQSFL